MAFFDQVTEAASASWLLNTVVALTIFVASLIIGKILGTIVEKLLANAGINDLLEKSTKLQIRVDKILSVIVAYIVYFGK